MPPLSLMDSNEPGRDADHAVMSPGVAVEVFALQNEASP